MIESIGIIHLLVIIWVSIHVARSKVSVGAQIFWIGFVVIFPIVGFLFWFFMGPRAVKNQRDF